MPELTRLLPPTEIANNSRLQHDITTCIDLIKRLHPTMTKNVRSLSRDSAHFIDFFRLPKNQRAANQLKRTLRDKLHQKRLKDLLTSFDHSTFHKARINELQNFGTGFAICSDASTPRSTMSDITFKITGRIRLGLSPLPHDQSPVICPCGDSLDPALNHNEDPAMLGCHPMWGAKFKRSAATRAHDFIVAVLAQWARASGIMVHIEHRPPWDKVKKEWPDRKRPDLLFIFPSHPNDHITLIYSDVTLSYLGSPCYREAVARNPQNAMGKINTRGQAKRKKYEYLYKNRPYASFLAAAA
jgi:hypothetical protein